MMRNWIPWRARRLTYGFYPYALIGALLVAIAGTLGPTRAEEPRHIVVVETMSLPFLQETTDWFRRGLSDLGYEEGKDFRIRVVNAEGKFARAQELLSGTLAEGHVDLVVSIATLATQASREILKDGNVPQVFTLVADPVGEGFVSAIGEKSGSNITGQTHVVPANAKLNIVAQSIANLTKNKPLRIGLLRSTYPSAISDAIYLFADAGDYAGIQLSELVFKYVPGSAGRKVMRATAIALLKARKGEIDALWLATGPNQLDTTFIRRISTLDIPIIYGEGNVAGKEGAMIGLRSDAEINGRAAAALARRIFDGALPSEIAVTRPNTFSVTVNVTTAQKLGAVIPSHILELAGENVIR